MLKKSLILGSVLLLAGGAMFGWILTERENRLQEASLYKLKYGVDTEDYIKQYEEWLKTPPLARSELPPILEENGKAMTREQLRQEQQERLQADLDKLASGEMAVHPFADILYGENWQNELNAYKKQNELNEHVLTGSIVCTTMGGSIYAWWILFWGARSFKKGLSGLRHRVASRDKNLEKVEDDEPVITGVEELKQEQQQKKSHEKQNRFEKHLNVFDNSGQQCPIVVKSGHNTGKRVASKGIMSNNTERINKLLSDEKIAADKTTTQWGKQRSEVEEHSKPLKTAINELTQQVSAIQLSKQRSEAEENSKPLNNAINELTQQVSAIREYASCQQDRLEKLQDGYDWNIIRTFCLRVIRCIDNLESRIIQLGDEDAKAVHLEEVKDELIFALESSGIEQFEPEIHSEYRGQEKFAEAVKDKEESDDPNQTGKIAQVIRPGYQYFINEENIKVVRPAQVKLFA
jgi:molecular chaperone GrpE (heat shock protein)